MAKQIVIFASGSGSNAEEIIKHFEAMDNINVVHVFTNKEKAGVIGRASKYNIPITIFKKSVQVFEQLKNINPDLIVLAGYLKLIPSSFVHQFPNKIINIHPALLPKYGGKGMYGMHVHEAVLKNKEHFSGITIHFVNHEYDEGAIIFQAEIDIENALDAKDIAQKVLQLEHKHYPIQIEKLLS